MRYLHNNDYNYNNLFHIYVKYNLMASHYEMLTANVVVGAALTGRVEKSSEEKSRGEEVNAVEMKKYFKWIMEFHN